MIHLRFFSSPGFAPAAVRWLALSILLVGAGCATGEYSYSTRIADGQRLTYRLINGRPEDAKVDGLEARPPQIVPDMQKKKLRLAFGFVDPTSLPLRSVRVEDVSGDAPMLMVEDLKPEFTNRQWVGLSGWFDATSPELKWLSYLDDSFRVYRITVTRADGRVTVLNEGSMTSSFGKTMLRRIIGETY